VPALPGRVADTWVDEGGGGGGGAVASVDSRIGVVTLSDLYINLTEKAAANGVATLDAGSKIPAAQIPAIALSEFLGSVASEAAMLALVGQRGDWCIRTDLDPDSIFILETDDPTQAANWTNVTGLGVVSVDGQVGIVDLSAVYQPLAADLTDLVARWVAASAAAPASLDFLEDTDNGANKATVTAPAALGADRVLTLPDVTGTLLTGAQADALYVPKSSTTWALKSVTKIRRTSGNISLNTGTNLLWGNLETSLDLTAAAVAGDRARVHISGVCSNELPAGFIDVVSLVAGSPVNSFANQGAVTASAPFFGIPNWRCHASVYTDVSGFAEMILAAGDLSGGNFTARFRKCADNNLTKDLLANTNYALTVWLEIWTPVA
jgi:hypothetical protein